MGEEYTAPSAALEASDDVEDQDLGDALEPLDPD
jgi:hypothetical protein